MLRYMRVDKLVEAGVNQIRLNIIVEPSDKKPCGGDIREDRPMHDPKDNSDFTLPTLFSKHFLSEIKLSHNR